MMTTPANILANPQRRPMIFASILSADFTRMGDDCAEVLELGCEALHVDVMDGHFVPNLTMGPDMCRSIRKRFPDVFLDVHLMVTDPQDFVRPFADAGANCISFHIEATRGRETHNERDLIRQIRDAGCDVGVVLNPPTPAEAVMHLLGDVDMTVVMSVNPGYAGQKFMPDALDKARAIRAAGPKNLRIEIDGGVGPSNAADCVEAGCDVLVTASALFGAGDRMAAIAAMRGR